MPWTCASWLTRTAAWRSRGAAGRRHFVALTCAGVGEGGVEGVGRGIGLFPSYGINDLEPHRLQGETEAEDDVVRAGDPDGAIRLEDAARLLQPPDVESVIPANPIERIESLRSLRFRLPLGHAVHTLEVLR